MDNFLIVAQQVAVLFALMGFGALARKVRLIDDRGLEGVVNLLILIVTPCIIVDCFQRPYDPALSGGLGLAFAISVLGHLAVLALAYLFVRHRETNVRCPLLLAAVFSNAGFMGLPVEQAVLGDIGVFFGAVYIVVFNLFMWSWGYRTMKGGGGIGLKAFVNPGTVGLALGFPLFFFSVRLPEVVAAPIHHLSNLNTPLAMIVIGYCLVGAKFGKVLRLPGVYVAAGIRLVAYPLLVLAALYPFRHQLDRNMMLAVVIAASAPVAAMVSMFASKFNRDVDTAVALVSGTTLLSILTMPPVIALAMSVL